MSEMDKWGERFIERPVRSMMQLVLIAFAILAVSTAGWYAILAVFFPVEQAAKITQQTFERQQAQPSEAAGVASHPRDAWLLRPSKVGTIFCIFWQNHEIISWFFICTSCGSICTVGQAFRPCLKRFLV